MHIRKISTPPKIIIKMIKILLIVPLVALGAAVVYNEAFLLVLLSKVKHVRIMTHALTFLSLNLNKDQHGLLLELKSIAIVFCSK